MTHLPGQRAGRPGRAGRRAGVRTLLLAVLALAAVVAVRPPHAPPLYDGLGFPDELYRWVVQPAGTDGTTDKAPTTLSLAVDLTATATSTPATATSAEQGPQVALSVAPASLVAPAGSTRVIVTATPVAAPPPPPAGTVVSNLYRWAATADRPGTVQVKAGSDVFINLRADLATDRYVVVERWEGGAWSQLATRQVGTEIYAARIPDLAPIALVRLDRGTTPSFSPNAVDQGATAGTTTGSGVGGDGGGGVGGIGSVSGVGGTAPQQQSGGGPGAGLWLGFGVVLVLLAGALLLARRTSRTGGTGGTDDEGTGRTGGTDDEGTSRTGGTGGTDDEGTSRPGGEDAQ